MSTNSKPKRRYNATRRRVQANQTRLLILEAARKLFEERGYTHSTMDAIAEKAGVAPDTIYAVFGNKSAILRSLVEVTLVGDDSPAPFLERPFIQKTLHQSDPQRLINRFARDIYQIMTRMSPMFRLLRSTAPTEPEIAEILEKLLAERLRNMSVFTDGLRQRTTLREQPLPNQANISVWALTSGEMFDLLTHDLGWTEEQYVTWLSDSLGRLLLP